MMEKLWTKVGGVLVGGFLLGSGLILAAQPVQAHEGTAAALRAPTCSNLPTATGFFTASETAAISSTTADLTALAAPKMGTGTAANGGYENLRYAKITIPQLAAGELRVFDTRTSGVSDAILCRPGTDVTSRTSYSAHDAAERARAAAVRAIDNTDITESAAKSALRSAASALDSAARSLTAAGNTGAAATATSNANAARTAANLAADTSEGDEVTALGLARDALVAARDAFHARFRIRTEVNPGDEEYVLVIATDAPPTWDLQFHGAIITSTATNMQRQRTLNAGDQHTYPITVTAPGLLTVETTGSTDTAGMLSGDPAPMDDSSGSGDNFKIVAPVTATTYTVTVDGQTATTTGAYTLDMDFQVAMQNGLAAISGEVDVPTAPTWGTALAIADDVPVTTPPTPLQIQGSADEDYFLLTIADDNSGFLTIEATDDMTSATDAATTGTFYGPTGELTTDTNSGADSSHFRIRAPVEEGKSYLVKVTGTTGRYLLSMTLDEAEGDELLAVPGTQNAPDATDCTGSVTGEICPPSAGDPLETERYAFNIMESGVLYLHTTGSIDTVGTLYGPAGNRINDPAADDNSGDGNNFRIAANVGPGLHLLEVRGKTRMTTGVYSLVANFVAGPGAPVTPPTTGTDDDDVASLQAEVTRLRNELNECRNPVATDARGSLDNPPNGGFRSGIGLISGWVCAASDVEVRIATDRGIPRGTLQVAYGTSRPDVPLNSSCTNANAGFGMTYNFNHLAEGTYTITAYADGDTQIGEPRTFEVVHLEEFAPSDTNRFLQLADDVQERGVCRVTDFPVTGEDTFLRWEQSTQNFVIEDAG